MNVRTGHRSPGSQGALDLLRPSAEGGALEESPGTDILNGHAPAI